MLKSESSNVAEAKISVIQQHRLFAPESPCRVKAFRHLARPENTGELFLSSGAETKNSEKIDKETLCQFPENATILD